MAEEKSGGIQFDLGLPKVSSPGDVGAVSIGLAVGYFLDILLAPHFPSLGITPGAASVYTAAAVLGLKNIVQSLHSWRKEKALAGLHGPLFRAKRLDEAMAREGAQTLTEKAWDNELRGRVLLGEHRESLLETVNLYKEGFLDESTLTNKIDECLQELIRNRELRVTANKREEDRAAERAEAKRRADERSKSSPS